MSKRKIARTLRSLSPRQLAFLLVAVVLFAGLCFVLEKTGAMDKLLDTAGVTDSAALPADGTLEAHFIDVGNADAAFLTCDGVTLLIDAGEKGAGSTVVNYLRDHGVNRLDYVIATHADADHIGGMRTVLDEFPVGKFLMAYMPEGAEPTTATYVNLLLALEEKKIPVIDVQPGGEYALGEARLTILGPVEDSDDKNEQSVVCRVTHGSQRLLFTGDAGKEEETTLLQAGVDLRADLLKVGHHGSSTSSTADFLEAVGARIGVISCGVDNDYGHPHKEVLERLEAADVAVYRTDQSGTVKVTSDGKTLKVETEG